MAQPLTTTRAVTTAFAGTAITLPEGTPVVELTDGRGHVCYAVKSIKLLIELTGNAHDAKHRYCFLPNDAVEG